MLPLSFSDLADSPTIISSPHQHQFDPITSRAAHSIYYHHQLRKPVMPTRYWDHPGRQINPFCQRSFRVAAPASPKIIQDRSGPIIDILSTQCKRRNVREDHGRSCCRLFSPMHSVVSAKSMRNVQTNIPSSQSLCPNQPPFPAIVHPSDLTANMKMILPPTTCQSPTIHHSWQKHPKAVPQTQVINLTAISTHSNLRRQWTLGMR